MIRIDGVVMDIDYALGAVRLRRPIQGRPGYWKEICLDLDGPIGKAIEVLLKSWTADDD